MSETRQELKSLKADLLLKETKLQALQHIHEVMQHDFSVLEREVDTHPDFKGDVDALREILEERRHQIDHLKKVVDMIKSLIKICETYAA